MTPIPFHLPESTKQALAWLDAFQPPERLRRFMEGRSEAEKEAARAYLIEERKERAKRKREAE